MLTYAFIALDTGPIAVCLHTPHAVRIVGPCILGFTLAARQRRAVLFGRHSMTPLCLSLCQGATLAIVEGRRLKEEGYSMRTHAVCMLHEACRSLDSEVVLITAPVLCFSEKFPGCKYETSDLCSIGRRSLDFERTRTILERVRIPSTLLGIYCHITCISGVTSGPERPLWKTQVMHGTSCLMLLYPLRCLGTLASCALPVSDAFGL